MQTRALVYNASLRINERRRQTFKVTLCRFFTCFLYLSWVSKVEGSNCSFLELNPPIVVVEYGSSVSVDCSTDVTHDGMGWEASEGSVSMTKDKLITWRVSNLRQWDIRPQCYINYNRKQCETFLPITIYKTPDSVSINTLSVVNQTVTEGSQNELQCNISNVAPVKGLIVKWFKGETEVKTETFINTTKTPVNETSTLVITADRDDDGAQYRCEAELELGADGPQPPPKVTSEPFNINVHFKPAINETKLPSTVSVIRGYPLWLVCEADGNPTPNISWSNGSSSTLETSNGILTLDEVSDEAFYTCTAVNTVNTTTRIVKVVITDVYIKQVNHTGPMIEGSQYELQCDIVNVAHVKSLTVKWFKGERELQSETFNDTTKTPVKSKLQITANRSDNGTQCRCEAEMNVEPAAQNGSTLKSKSFTIEVYFKPVINVDKLPSQVPIFRGYPVVLSCEADGYPTPEISWKINHNVLVKGGTLNITEAASQNIICIANNAVGNDSREVKVVLTGPSSIDIKPVNHTGPMINGSEYELQCDIVNVAPVKSLTVKWFKGEKEVHNKTFKTPSVNETSILKITANRSEIGIEYRCEAEMTAEPAAQNISRLKSNFTVQFKPVINETKLPSEVPVFRGYPVVLTCEANGNPTPEIRWKTNPNNIVNGENLTITEAISQNPVCIANNPFGTVHREVNVVLTEDYLPLIAGLVAITVAVISVIFIFIYSIYYKTAKMGHYTLKDTKPCTQNGKIALNGKDNTSFPMKKLSESDIFA
nr:hemicentin-1-like [Misgurnus anguillicaudatus]